MKSRYGKQAVKVAFVGLGRRGMATLRRHLAIPQAAVICLCDSSAEALAEALAAIPPDMEMPLCFDSWRGMLGAGIDADLVYVSTDWTTHAQIAIAALEHGYDVAVEVPAVIAPQEGSALKEAVRKSGRFFTMVENCCYDPFHLYTMQLVSEGLLGQITHCEGAYIHDIRDELSAGSWQSQLTGRNHANPYPTHGLGPVCQILGVSSGADSLERVVSMSPVSGGTNSSLISTSAGRTILLQYDVTTPRPYSRLQTVCGTAGYMSKYPQPMLMLDGMKEPLTGDALDSFLAGHRHPLLDAYEHDGLSLGVANMMNYIMDRRQLDLIMRGASPDITVDDAVLWSSLSWLTRKSVENGNIPVTIP